MRFMTAVENKIRKYGLSRKVAVLIVRLERGIDSLDNLCEIWRINRRGGIVPLLSMTEYLQIVEHQALTNTTSLV